MKERNKDISNINKKGKDSDSKAKFESTKVRDNKKRIEVKKKDKHIDEKPSAEFTKGILCIVFSAGSMDLYPECQIA